MANIYLDAHKEEFSDILQYLEKELGGIRSGRARPILVENIKVEAYGGMMPLMQVASISVPDSRQLLIQPWDAGLIKNIEKAITESSLSLNPVVDGETLRITIPSLTEERMQDLCKVVRDKGEESKVAVRHVREKIKEGVEKDFKAKILREDDKFKYIQELDKAVSEANEKIRSLLETKETEITTV